MKTMRVPWLVLLWLVLASASGRAQAQPPTGVWQPFAEPLFQQISADDGLPDTSIAALAQGADGYLWIGTANGLVRYDGQHLYTVGGAGNKADHRYDGYIRSLLVLDSGRLLVGSNSAGLALLDPRTLQFTPVPVGAARSTRVRILSLRPARDGGVWVASDLGLDHFDPATNTTTPVALTGLPGDRSQRVFDVAEGADGQLWLGTSQGLFTRAPGARRFRHVSDPRFAHGGLVWRLYLDRFGRLWVGTDMSGVFVIDPDGRHWAPPGLYGAHGLTHGNTVRDFLTTPDGRLWIATYGSGIIVCPDKACRKPRSIRASRNDRHGLASNTVRAMLLDDSGTLWFGTVAGLSRTVLSQGSVLHVGGSTDNARALAGRAVLSVLVDDRQRVWLGLGDGGVVILDLRHGTSQHLGLPRSVAHQSVAAMVQTADGTVWVAGLGVLGVDPDTLEVVARIPALAARRVTALDAAGTDLIVSTYIGIYRYQPSNDHLAAIWRDGAMATTEALKNVHWMLHTKTRHWYATNHGLATRRIGQRGIRLFRHQPGDRHSLPHDFVSMLAWDASRRRLWVASKGGLAWLHVDTAGTPGPFHWIQPDGTPGPVTAVILDAHGNAWATGDDRLMRVDADTLEVTPLAHADGLPHGSFIWHAAAVGPYGALLFGGTTGLTVVQPGRFPLQARAEAPLRITRVHANSRLLSWSSGPDAALALASDQRSIRVNFSLLDYRAPGDIRYAYRLAGFEHAWHHVAPGTPAKAVYTNLPSGNYRLQLRARTPGLGAHTATRSYPLSVAPHWYETWLARVLQLLAALLLAAALVYAGLRWSRHRQLLLDRLIGQRTRELRQANAKLETLATTDALTGLNRRGAFMDLAKRALDEAIAHQQPLSMLLMDLDEFKAINDTHGHLAGDSALQAVAGTVNEACRGSEIIGRYGGEEFVLCMPNSDAAAARALARRLCANVAALMVRYGSETLTVTCSIGVATREPEDTRLSQLLSRTDKALYRAKNRGRNRVEVAS